MVGRSEITWLVLAAARRCLDPIRKENRAAYEEEKVALQEFLCGYFNSDAECKAKQGNQVSPMQATTAGGKCLKVRWGLPGHGKSGGLRLAVVAYCEERRVKIAGAWLRRDEPGDAEFSTATQGE